jgi:glycogen synthase
LRSYNYYPSIIQSNEWPCWLTAAYLTTWKEFREDVHFAGTKAGSIMHNPHPSYGIVLNEANPVKRHYYCWVMGLDPNHDYDLAVNRSSPDGHPIEMMHTMLKTSHFIGTVSKAMKERMMRETWLFGHAHDFNEKDHAGLFFARRNGFNMAARQRFWFGTRKSIVETWQPAARRRLFYKYYAAKKTSKLDLQIEPNIRLTPDGPGMDHVIFSMLHRISKQKGFELLVDWKVYTNGPWRDVRCEEWNLGGPTVLEFFLQSDPRIQFVICGRVEDSPDGRRFDMHLRRIASRQDLRGRFAYYPEGNLNPALYRNVYVGAQYFVMPSGGEVGEPCGISQQEAHAGGTPVVAHHQDGLQYTVSDSDFGDREYPTNGVKFSGFNGQALLDALLDAVEIYYSGQRRNYRDSHGRPKKLDYDEMVFNAFARDHRWIRPLRDYVAMYTHVLGTRLPDHLDALRILEETAGLEDAEIGDVILRFGLTVPQAISGLIHLLGCNIASVQRRSVDTLVRLLLATQDRHLTQHTLLLLREAKESANPGLAEFADGCIQRLVPPAEPVVG